MSEYLIFVSGGIFLAAMTLALVRLGRRSGGVAWACAWACEYVSGGAAAMSAPYPFVAPLVPIFGTGFAYFLVQGALRFTGRRECVSRPLATAAIVITVVRTVAHAFVSEGTSQILGSLVIQAAVIVSCWAFFRPPGRTSTAWERRLGWVFLPIAFASGLYAWTKATGHPVLPSLIIWSAASNGVCFVQVAAFIARATERIDALSLEAARSRDAKEHVEARYRELTEQVSDMITEIDSSGQILYANPAHEVVLGLKPEELEGMSIDVLFPRRPSRNREGGRSLVTATFPSQRILVARHRNGDQRTLECHLRRFRLESGEERLVATTRDVTQRVAAERRLEAGREQLENLVEERTSALNSSLQKLRRSQRLASMGTLAAGIAHQINNPIGSIRMSSEFALRSDGQEDEHKLWREALEHNREQAVRCGRIVSSMLQFARNEPTPKSAEDLAPIVLRVCEQTEDFARRHRAMIDTRGVEGPLVVLGSSIELEQALLNVVRNACESSDGPVRVEVSATGERGAAIVIVADDGRGMDAVEIEHVFEPFYTTRLGRGGTGLGLSVTHGVVTDHGGLVSIESKRGVGTKVAISIPLIPPTES